MAQRRPAAVKGLTALPVCTRDTGGCRGRSTARERGSRSYSVISGTSFVEAASRRSVDAHAPLAGLHRCTTAPITDNRSLIISSAFVAAGPAADAGSSDPRNSSRHTAGRRKRRQGRWQRALGLPIICFAAKEITAVRIGQALHADAAARRVVNR